MEIKGPSLSKQLFGGTTSFLSAATVVIFLTYFLLAVGDLFLQKLVAVLPQFKDKKMAVTIARETEAQISLYLFTITLINIGVGVVTAVWSCSCSACRTRCSGAWWPWCSTSCPTSARSRTWCSSRSPR